jgi:acyl-CoA hydrolase
MVANLVIVNAFLTFVSRATMDVRVEVVVEEIFKEEKHHALTAHFIMVAVDDSGKPIDVPPLIISSQKEEELWESGKKRNESCRGELMSGDDEYRVCRENALF